MPADRRLAVVLSRYRAVPPPGVPAADFGAACLADSYEAVSDLSGVTSAIAAGFDAAELLWPGSPQFPDLELDALVDAVATADLADVLALIPADVPDLPGLVVAKVFQALGRAEVAVAPELGGPGCAVLGVRLPRPPWWPTTPLALEVDPYDVLGESAPRRNLVVHTPGWHRLRTPASVALLDPGLEGWEQTRALLSGRPLGSSSGGG